MDPGDILWADSLNDGLNDDETASIALLLLTLSQRTDAVVLPVTYTDDKVYLATARGAISSGRFKRAGPLYRCVHVEVPMAVNGEQLPDDPESMEVDLIEGALSVLENCAETESQFDPQYPDMVPDAEEIVRLTFDMFQLTPVEEDAELGGPPPAQEEAQPPFLGPPAGGAFDLPALAPFGPS